jgi:hypothetical protein
MSGGTAVPAEQNPFASQNDAKKPAMIAARVEAAGGFIAFGALLYTLVVSDSTLGVGSTRRSGGLAFSAGLILVVIARGELFVDGCPVDCSSRQLAEQLIFGPSDSIMRQVKAPERIIC